MVYLKSMENVITLSKLIGLLFLFCLPLLSILFLKLRTKRNDFARPVMGNHFSSNQSVRYITFFARKKCNSTLIDQNVSKSITVQVKHYVLWTCVQHS